MDNKSNNSFIIREETPNDYYETECCVRDSFWNLYKPGADEHCLVRHLRSSPDYLPELSRIAINSIDNTIVGAIFYSKTLIVTETGKADVITFAPLCVHPDHQNKGIGKRLLLETIELAKAKGYSAIIIMGLPLYYPKFGFKNCDRFNITTEDGKNFDAFMCLELHQDALKDVKGYFHLGEVFNERSQIEIEEFDKKYSPKVKEIKPTQLKSHS